MPPKDFASSLRSNVRGLWLGVLDTGQFFGAMELTLNKYLKEAWLAGAAECGIAEADLSPEEKTALAQFIFEQVAYLPGFAEAINENNKVSGGKPEPLFTRLELWANRYGAAQAQASAMACADRKEEWFVNEAIERHCRDCYRVKGKVFRSKTWTKYGWIPKSSALACRGFRCGCERRPTDKPVDPGRPPDVLGPE